MSRSVSLFAVALLCGSAAAEVVDDPMRPPNYVTPEAGRPAATAATYTLSSVVIGVDRRVAVINGSTLSVGDRSGAATVIDIQPSGVTLARDGQRFVVRLATLDVKQIAKKP